MKNTGSRFDIISHTLVPILLVACGGVSPESCGPSTCLAGQHCCDASCGICSIGNVCPAMLARLAVLAVPVVQSPRAVRPQREGVVPNRPEVYWVLAARIPRVAAEPRVARRTMADPTRVAAPWQPVARRAPADPKPPAALWQLVELPTPVEQHRRRHVRKRHRTTPHLAATRRCLASTTIARTPGAHWQLAPMVLGRSSWGPPAV